MIQRLIEIRKSEGLNQEQFAKKLGMSRSFVNQVEVGKRKLSDRTIADICRIFNVNEDWFRTGTGDMYNPVSEDRLFDFYDASKCNNIEARFLQSYFSLSEQERLAFCNFLMKMFPESFANVEDPFGKVWKPAPSLLHEDSEENLRKQAGDLYLQELLAEEKPDAPASSANESAVG